MKRLNAPRGLTLVETMTALGVLSLGLVGVAQLQVVIANSNVRAQRQSAASALAVDLIENVATWAYDDPRLATTTTVTSSDADAVTARLDIGADEDVDEAHRPHFAEHTTGNASQDEALHGDTARYDGVRVPLNAEGRPEFERYWSVFALAPDGGGVEQGKLVVVTVRFRDGALGFRQVSMTTYRSNVTSLFQ